MIVSYIIAAALIIEILLIRVKPHLNISINFLLIVHLTFSLYLIIDGGIYQTGILWINSFPVLLYYLKGKRNGNLWMIFVAGILLFLSIMSLKSYINIPYTSFQVFAEFVLLITISILIVFYEDSKAKSLNLATYQLSHDLYTGLPNRARLIADINKNDEGALLRIDINNLTDISSVFGFSYAIDILKEFIKEIKEQIKDYGEVYLLTNDELAIFFEDEDFLRIQPIIQNILDSKTYINAIRNKYNIDLHIIGGISSMKSCNKDDLLSSAELALKMARDQKTSVYHCNNPSLIRSKFQDNINWSVLIRNALENNRIFPSFQPIINNRTGKIEKYESLVRMKTMDEQIKKPDQFLGISKKTDMYYQLTRVMIDKSFNAFENMPYSFSINLSIKDIHNREVNQFVIQKLKKYSRPEAVIFEITESESIENYDELNRFIKIVKRYGSKIAIDDFGSGYSNFNHIIQMDIDFLKLDASLIRPILKDKNSEILVQSIIHLAKKIKVETIAEFVENEKIFKKINSMGIDYSQGYYIGKPVIRIPDPIQ